MSRHNDNFTGEEVCRTQLGSTTYRVLEMENGNLCVVRHNSDGTKAIPVPPKLMRDFVMWWMERHTKSIIQKLMGEA